MEPRFYRTLAGFVVAAAALAGGLAPQLARADSPADAGRTFVPHPQSEDRFGVYEPPKQPLNGVTAAAAPNHDPRGQIHDVIGRDHAHIYTETYLPAPTEGGPPVSDKLPTLLIYTPYESTTDSAVGAAAGVSESAYNKGVALYWAARGYAVTIAHARGTGKSDGCNDYGGELERDDISRVIEYLGRDAPWTTGRVGMYGASYPATTQIAAATLGAQEHPERTRYLKAIVPIAPVTSAYALFNSDGVPYTAVGFPTATPGMLLFATPDSGRPTDGASCQATEHAAGNALPGVSGDFGDWFAEREYRRAARDVEVPVLMVSNLFDSAVPPSNAVGFFNQLPADTPHKIVLSAAGHSAPELQNSRPAGWQRTDWLDAVTAWYDRWLKGLDTGVEDWPAAQVQEAATGQWHSEDSWPPLGAPGGRLALSSAPAEGHDGAFVLGDIQPTGSTTYSEDSVHPDPANPEDSGTGDTAIWWTAPLEKPLHLTGEPYLDLWVTLDRPDAHVVANLQAFGPPTDDAPGGKALLSGVEGPAVADGRRSVQHLDPLVDERFEQRQGHPLEHPEEPHLIPIRFWPVDVVIPTGGRLRLSLAGVSQANKGANPTSPGNPSAPSEAGANITVLEDCQHTSVLGFSTPTPHSKLLNVREPREDGLDPLPSNPPSATPRDDGGGIGKGAIC